MNYYRIEGHTAFLTLTQGQETAIDSADLPRVLAHRWCADKSRKTFYVQSWIRGRKQKLHRFIVGCPAGRTVDHRDHDGLNNRRGNLRVCVAADNGKNRLKNANNTSGFKGVTWRWATRNWQARLGIDRKRISLGYFSCPKLAAKAYDTAAKILHGDFANLNFK